jgi:phage-related protein
MKALAVLYGVIKTPPMSANARREAGFLLRMLQSGEVLSLPQSRPMPVIGARCHELRIVDENQTWRVMYRIDADAVVVVDVFSKKTPRTPAKVITACRRRLKEYDDDDA